MEAVYGRRKSPTPLPTTPYAECFTEATNIGLTKLSEKDKRVINLTNRHLE